MQFEQTADYNEFRTLDLVQNNVGNVMTVQWQEKADNLLLSVCMLIILCCVYSYFQCKNIVIYRWKCKIYV
jgi:hypothetical protein